MELFSHLAGQHHLRGVECAIERNQLAPAYLFCGSVGIGKATAALALAHHLTGDKSANPDRLWIEPTYLKAGELITKTLVEQENLRFPRPPQIRVEQIREVVNFVSQSPLQSERLVVVVEGVETLNSTAANAFLKTLEEPGDKATIILTCNNPDRLLPTIISRCFVVPFVPLSQGLMKKVLADHDIPEAVRELAQGSPGRAIAYHKIQQSIPSHLLNPQITKLSEALTLAKEIGELSLEQQMFFGDWWQRDLMRHGRIELVQVIETAKQQLVKASPQLVWENTLMQIVR